MNEPKSGPKEPIWSDSGITLDGDLVWICPDLVKKPTSSTGVSND
jgi:hypothetical protein